MTLTSLNYNFIKGTKTCDEPATVGRRLGPVTASLTTASLNLSVNNSINMSTPVMLVMLLAAVRGAQGDDEVPSARTVQTHYGTLRGVVRKFDVAGLHPVEKFLGVPYATPPIHGLRFMPPLTPSPWDGIKMVPNSFNIRIKMMELCSISIKKL